MIVPGHTAGKPGVGAAMRMLVRRLQWIKHPGIRTVGTKKKRKADKCLKTGFLIQRMTRGRGSRKDSTGQRLLTGAASRQQETVQ